MTASLSARVAVAVRVGAGTGLAWFAAAAVVDPQLPFAARAAAVGVAVTTGVSPLAGLVATIALTPAGLLMAPPPARCAELIVCAFLSVWLLAAWRPLSSEGSESRPLLPALLYGGCAAASWLAYTVSGAAGIEPLRIPASVMSALRPDHLVWSSPEPETLTLLPLLAGLGLFAAAAVITRAREAARLAVVSAVTGSAAVLAVLTVADVLRQWGAAGYGGWFLLRYFNGERYSFQFMDLNAAGSQYVLGLLAAAAMAAGDARRRALWIALAVLMLPALWISGSRSAPLAAIVVGLTVIPLVRRRIPVPRVAARALVMVLVLGGVATGGAVLALGPAEQGSASNALRLRSQFLVTSARMFASAPVFGVGIGHYHERSHEFMPASLRQVYAYENAHNYFAQQFAELGALGGLLFVWLVAAALTGGWQHARDTFGLDVPMLALLAGTGAYLLTCVTGHPLLVPEAALPFWGAFGALAGGAARARPVGSIPRYDVARRIAIVLLLAMSVNVALHARRAMASTTQPGERGFYSLERAADGSSFVWMTRHGVFYIGRQPGTLTIPVQAPALPGRGVPFTIEAAVAGRPAGVYDVPSGRWTAIEIPAPVDRLPFRRVDLRANQSWTPMRDRGARSDDLPRSVMVGEIRWVPAGSR